jgi:hypothetical protein
LLNTAVPRIHHRNCSIRAEGQADRLVELTRPVAKLADDAQEVALPVQQLQPVVACVCHQQQAVGQQQQVTRAKEETQTAGIRLIDDRTAAAKAADPLPVQRKALHAVVPGVGHVEMLIADGHAPRFVELARPAAEFAPTGEETAVLVKHLYLMIAGVGHVDTAVIAHGHIARRVQALVSQNQVRADREFPFGIGVQLLHQGHRPTPRSHSWAITSLRI